VVTLLWRIRCASLTGENTILNFHNVGYSYSGGPELLRDVSFSLQPGTLTFLSGPTGSGKSTVLRLCNGRETPSCGNIFALGISVSESGDEELASVRKRIGAVFQDLLLVDHLSVFDNVALPLRLAGHTVSAYGKDIQELLSWAGLGEKAQERPAALSSGERQRVAIARALAGKPDLLLADEPFTGLDDEAGQRVSRLLLNIHRFGATVLIATRDRAAAARNNARELRVTGGCVREAAAIG
jgi:cell division transport system ATP-binding protein